MYLKNDIFLHCAEYNAKYQKTFLSVRPDFGSVITDFIQNAASPYYISAMCYFFFHRKLYVSIYTSGINVETQASYQQYSKNVKTIHIPLLTSLNDHFLLLFTK